MDRFPSEMTSKSSAITLSDRTDMFYSNHMCNLVVFQRQSAIDSKSQNFRSPFAFNAPIKGNHCGILPWN